MDIPVSTEELKTPLFKILLFIGVLTLSVFGIFLFLIRDRNQDLKTAYKQLSEEGNQSFSTLTGYHQIAGENNKKHIYTYLVTDEFGKLHEITEFVDKKSHLKLRVGNSIVTRQKKVVIAGKEKIISRIEGNNQQLPNFDYLEEFAYLGIYFSILIATGSFALFLFKRKLV